ncbi:MAG: nicotinate-nucleotide--dimethylbenzimidazole phosphoribosyltransferase [Syntrophomonas sp.]|uniref:nicotinate-nucleotide--dimethylbenzimidazole phosphoribosyltransferase n=1 Tax=Syntrophomonas sp. TaxID=2053627 RepID=UPI002616DCF8|nr:nicotinate-nucleotide--dimethylbenzimidazole phosphoribosyltransferase [Syntrophomonas sp.]MDD2510664.1 nicotinate-nucleotide--dimethylbenzimidazole phosphoribosyltransferase [Syntrophomonas sp.]MDD3879607.1 nicotinate-nucleotide--dimethylbenzimidazole phosphoribosyltransferase [Syntrophomonas sp.]MDD4627453.1 nicotinate-nucleotide--dimethylbenzimidazole phosphoribosyltransferase [Syntrophomonas sp.]
MNSCHLGKFAVLNNKIQQLPQGINKYAVLIFAGDNGISLENFSSYPPLSSRDIVISHLKGESPTAALLNRSGHQEIIVDVGLYQRVNDERIIQRNIVRGSKNFLYNDALEKAQVEKSIEVGLCVWDDVEAEKFDIIGIGEIGIGNTLCAAGLAAVITGLEPEYLVGSGSASNKVINRKIDILSKALKLRSPDPDDLIDLLARFGGLELAALTGFILASVNKGKIIMLDGYVTAVTALLASRIDARVSSHLIAPSTTGEPGHWPVLKQLALEPVFDWAINYGEGLAAAIALFLAEVFFFAGNQN